jgi:hypothetical protein
MYIIYVYAWYARSYSALPSYLKFLITQAITLQTLFTLILRWNVRRTTSKPTILGPRNLNIHRSRNWDTLYRYPDTTVLRHDELLSVPSFLQEIPGKNSRLIGCFILRPTKRRSLLPIPIHVVHCNHSGCFMRCNVPDHARICHRR